MLPETADESPSSWPKEPNSEQRMHHSPVEAPHQLLSGHDSSVVWTRSPVPLDMPGQRNSSPVWVDGAVPGVRVVTALVMRDLVGPSETAPPQESDRRAMVLVGGPMGTLRISEAPMTAVGRTARKKEDFMAAVAGGVLTRESIYSTNGRRRSCQTIRDGV